MAQDWVPAWLLNTSWGQPLRGVKLEPSVDVQRECSQRISVLHPTCNLSPQKEVAGRSPDSRHNQTFSVWKARTPAFISPHGS